MNKEEIIDWLLEGDVSIQYQVWRDLFGIDKKIFKRELHLKGGGKNSYLNAIQMHIGEQDFINPNGFQPIIHYSIYEIYTFPKTIKLWVRQLKWF